MFEDTKGVIRSRKLKEDRQKPKEKDKRTNNEIAQLKRYPRASGSYQDFLD